MDEKTLVAEVEVALAGVVVLVFAGLPTQNDFASARMPDASDLVEAGVAVIVALFASEVGEVALHKDSNSNSYSALQNGEVWTNEGWCY